MTISRKLIAIKSRAGQFLYVATCRYVSELPKPGESMSAMFREKCYGGKAANQCVAARKLGASCALIAKMGNDDLGKEYLKYLSDMLINTDSVKLMDGEFTGFSQTNVDDRAANTVVVLYGANNKLNVKEVKDYKKHFKNAKVLLCQLESDPKAVLCALNMFKGVSVLNASPVTNKTITDELLAAPSILCVNEIEAAQLTEREHVKTVYEAKAAANDLLLKGAKSVIITLGDQGAIHLSKKEQDRCIHCPAAPIRYLADTSGAGDAFLGSLAYHIARYPNLEREYHIHAANLCAAHSVGQRGTQPSFPGPDLAQTDLCRQTPLFSLVPDEDPNAGAVPPRVTINPEAKTLHPADAVTSPVVGEAAAPIPVEARRATNAEDDGAKRATDAAKMLEAEQKRERLSTRMGRSMLEPGHVPSKEEQRASKMLHSAAPSETSQKTESTAGDEAHSTADAESKKDRLSTRLSRTLGLAQPHETAKIMPKPVGGAHHLARSSVAQYKRHANVPYTPNRYVQKPKKRAVPNKKVAES